MTLGVRGPNGRPAIHRVHRCRLKTASPLGCTRLIKIVWFADVGSWAVALSAAQAEASDASAAVVGASTSVPGRPLRSQGPPRPSGVRRVPGATHRHLLRHFSRFRRFSRFSRHRCRCRGRCRRVLRFNCVSRPSQRIVSPSSYYTVSLTHVCAQRRFCCLGCAWSEKHHPRRQGDDSKRHGPLCTKANAAQLPKRPGKKIWPKGM